VSDSGELEGVVVGKSSRHAVVEIGEGQSLRCEFRGRLRSGWASTSVVAGDRVVVSVLGGGEGVIERVLERKSELIRWTGGRETILIAANVSQVLAVLSVREPPPKWALVDRMLVGAERDGLDPGIALNKLDLLPEGASGDEDPHPVIELYRSLGYPCFLLSAARGDGIEDLAGWLRGKMTVLSGHSGVGKSTILNWLCPSLGLLTGQVNAVTGKGRHTTTAVTLHPLPGGGYVGDTPGFREFLPADLRPTELGRHYPEFRAAMEARRCRYPDCIHREEPACSVRAALDSGGVHPLRYRNYLQILSTLFEGRGRGGML
jgi:ribosome biogenesis GTPase